MDGRRDRILKLMADGTNRAVLALLEGTDRAVSTGEVAEHLVAEEVLALPATEYESRLDRTRIALHHDCLPRLAEAGLIEYDGESRLAAPAGERAIDPEWLGIEFLEGALSKGGGDDIGVLEGREAVYEYARGLADTAEDELFLIYASAELLDEDCLPHAEGAIDRGVALQAGAKSPEVRRFFREYLPAATVWEPQGEWLGDRPGYPTLSRLVVADRERVAVGLWRRADGTETEVALIGEGSDNPLVALVRELLGSRLDHLDYQSDDFLNRVPFEP